MWFATGEADTGKPAPAGDSRTAAAAEKEANAHLSAQVEQLQSRLEDLQQQLAAALEQVYVATAHHTRAFLAVTSIDLPLPYQPTTTRHILP